MAYGGILPEVPSFGQLLARGIGEELGTGFGSTSQKLVENYSKSRLKKGERKALGLKGLRSTQKSIEDFEPLKYGDKQKNEIALEYSNFLEDNPDVREEDALRYVIDNYEKGLKERGELSNPETATSFEKSQAANKDVGNLGGLGDLISKLKNPNFQRSGEFEGQSLAQKFNEYNKAQGRSALAHGKDIYEHPGRSLAELGIGTARGLNAPLDILESLLRKTGAISENEKANLVSRLIGMGEEAIEGGMNPEEIKRSQARQFIASLFGPSALTKRISGLSKLKEGKAGTPFKTSEAARVAEDTLAGEGMASPVEKGLAGKVSKKVPLEPTEMRIERLKPREKLHKTKEQIDLREAQKKIAPQYEAEIAEDAAARAAREAAREPKTEVGLAGRAKRVLAAKTRLPEVQKSYYNSSARVRALEDEIAGLSGDARKGIQGVLEIAKKELQQAEFELRQAVANLKGESVRAGIPAMEKAAAEKMQKIAEMVNEGKEVTLAKMDYSPELIAKAKKIAKGRKLPAAHQDDFYTQVHDTYSNMYKRRLANIEKEMSQAMENRSLSGLYERQKLGKEKEALKKMIESAEAENIIHRHNLSLRELGARKKAAERFAKLKPIEGKKKVSKVAKEKIWKEKVKEAKTLEARAQAVEEGIEDIAKSNPSQAEQIRREGSSLKDALGKMEKDAESLKNSASSGSAKGEASKIQSRSRKLVQEIADLKKSFPFIWKSKTGQDLLIGVGTAVFDDIKKEYEFPITAGSVATLVLGRRTAGAIAVRSVANQLTKWILKRNHIKNAEKAYTANDMKKFKEFSPAIQKKAKENLRRS